MKKNSLWKERKNDKRKIPRNKKVRKQDNLDKERKKKKRKKKKERKKERKKENSLERERLLE